MKVTIQQGFCPKQYRIGTPCINILASWKATDKTTNEIISEVLEYRGKIDTICIAANLATDGEVVALIWVLAQTAFKIIIVTTTSDDISSLTFMKNLTFVMYMLMPSSESAGLNHTSINAMRDGDIIIVETEATEELDYAIKAIKWKILTRPEVTFLIPENLNSQVMKNKFTCNIRVINN